MNRDLTAALGDAVADYMTAVEDTIEQRGAERRLTERIGGERQRRVVVRAGVALASAGAAVAAVLAVGAVADQRADNGLTAPSDGKSQYLPFGTVPAGFPSGRFAHPGYQGLTVLRLYPDGNAVIDDPQNEPIGMRMRFRPPGQVEITLTSTVAGPGRQTEIADCGAPAVYTYTLTTTQLTFHSSYANDPCGARRVQLTEKPWDLH
jgi:hypothetical protein